MIPPVLRAELRTPTNSILEETQEEHDTLMKRKLVFKQANFEPIYENIRFHYKALSGIWFLLALIRVLC